MITFLTWATLIVAGVIVLVLATFLILVAVALVKANRNLAKLAGGLEAIRDNTRPLAGQIPAVNAAAVSLRDRLRGVDGNVQGIAREVRG